MQSVICRELYNHAASLVRINLKRSAHTKAENKWNYLLWTKSQNSKQRTTSNKIYEREEFTYMWILIRI